MQNNILFYIYIASHILQWTVHVSSLFSFLSLKPPIDKPNWQLISFFKLDFSDSTMGNTLPLNCSLPHLRQHWPLALWLLFLSPFHQLSFLGLLSKACFLLIFPDLDPSYYTDLNHHLPEGPLGSPDPCGPYTHSLSHQPFSTLCIILVTTWYFLLVFPCSFVYYLPPPECISQPPNHHYFFPT